MSAVPHSFQTTHWSIVRQAVGRDDPAAKQALASLCESYWYPIYAYFRRSGKNFHDAEDLTQGFFAKLVSNETLAAADPEKGRLRTYLLTCAQHFLRDQHSRATAQKRDETLLVSYDSLEAEKRYASEPRDSMTPDRLFQRRWALAVLEESLKSLADEFERRGQSSIFAELRPFLGFGAGPGQRFEDISARLCVPVGTLKNQVFRLRERWRQLLFEQVAGTLENPTPEEIKAELAELLGAV